VATLRSSAICGGFQFGDQPEFGGDDLLDLFVKRLPDPARHQRGRPMLAPSSVTATFTAIGRVTFLANFDMSLDDSHPKCPRSQANKRRGVP